MARKKILVVEDDRNISNLIAYNLKSEHYDIDCLYDGGQVVEFVRKCKPDLIILDLMLPEVDGLEICQTLKNDPATKTIPIIMLTAKGEEMDMVVGFQMGADDYISKPFSPKVLVARIKAIFRRMSDLQQISISADHVRTFGDLKIDLLKHKISYKDHEIKLTSIEFDIVEFLSRTPGRVWSREQILDNVWKEGKFIIDRAVDVHVRGLRKKMDEADVYIETVRGVGYRFKDNE
ncbi:MAG: response regulator transcription factor [Candidatus Omnitrophica bacterium]|nr:response regulator transcription factor [Candidatus Omnitrophota bacterium]